MTTRDLLEALRAEPERPLRFRTPDGTVPGGYHVTEIKAATVRTVDCGGRAHAWNETILQVLPPALDAGEAPMPARTFLAIVDRVRDALALDDDAYLRVEHGPPGGSATNYRAEAIEVGADGFVVRLAAPAVACKGADAALPDLPVVTRRDAVDAAPVACC